MQAIWLLPALISAVVFSIRSGDWLIAYMTAASLILSSIIAKRRSPQSAETAHQVSYRRNRIYLDGKKLPRSSLLWLPRWNRLVHEHIKTQPATLELGRLLDRAKAQSFRSASAGKLRVWLGSSASKDFELDLVQDGPHVFVVGPTGSGKSQLLRLLLTSATSTHSPARLQLMVADFKGSALLQGLNFAPWMLMQVDDLQVDQQPAFWNRLSEELTSRETRLKNDGKSAFDYFDASHPQLIVVVDEVAAACKSSPKVVEVLSAVAARGRSLGVVLVVANQGLSQVPRELLLNLRLRIALAGTDQVELVQLGGQSKKISNSQPGWLAARLISQAGPDQDFDFVLLGQD